jgi:ribosome-binding factor A
MRRRQEKLNKLIQKTLGEMIQKEVELPPDVLVTIASVETTDNLRSAIIWLYIFPIEKSDTSMAILERERNFLQGMLNRALRMRPIPRIKFSLDRGAAHADHINNVLKDITVDDDHV